MSNLASTPKSELPHRVARLNSKGPLTLSNLRMLVAHTVEFSGDSLVAVSTPLPPYDRRQVTLTVTNKDPDPTGPETPTTKGK